MEHKAALVALFPRVFGKSDTLREMYGRPMHIQLTDDAQPFSVTAARAIPYSWRGEIKRQLDDLLAKDVIAVVDYPTEWCHPIVLVAKKLSRVRLRVDLTRLNKYVNLSDLPTPSAPLMTPLHPWVWAPHGSQL